MEPVYPISPPHPMHGGFLTAAIGTVTIDTFNANCIAGTFSFQGAQNATEGSFKVRTFVDRRP